MATEKETKKQKTKETIRRELKARYQNLRGGRGVSIEFFRRHGWLLSILLVVVLSLMGLRYKTQTRMVEIKRLNPQLERAQSEKLFEKKQYMTLIRQTKMNELVRANRLNLIHQEQPPYEIDGYGTVSAPDSISNSTKTDSNETKE